MIEIRILRQSYNCYGGHSTLSLVGSFIAMGSPDFGSALTEIEVTSHHRSTQPPKKTLGSAYEKHHEFLKSLPKSRFLRKKSRLTIDFYSEVATAEDLEKYCPPDLELFVAFYQEVRVQFTVIKKKIKSSDDFDVAQFVAWVEGKELELPKNEAELEQLTQEIERIGKARRDAMDDWEKLGIDWCDYHPNARTILDEPFYWECADDFAPNGNDTGADVLHMFAEWRKRHRKTSSKRFFDQLLEDWRVSRDPAPDDLFSIQTYTESAVGLAFAQLKLEASCPEWSRYEALNAIKKLEVSIKADHPDWDLFDERMRTLDLMRRKLENAPEPDAKPPPKTPDQPWWRFWE